MAIVEAASPRWFMATREREVVEPASEKSFSIMYGNYTDNQGWRMPQTSFVEVLQRKKIYSFSLGISQLWVQNDFILMEFGLNEVFERRKH